MALLLKKNDTKQLDRQNASAGTQTAGGGEASGAGLAAAQNQATGTIAKQTATGQPAEQLMKAVQTLPVQRTQGSNLSGVSASTNAALSNYQKGYSESSAVVEAKNKLAEIEKKKPGAFVSGFQEELDDLYDKIKNRDPFSWDMDSDALYQQYAEQYRRQGQNAMQDTIGQASAMTGGYGNSYAETAGFQAYQNYMNALNDKALEIYDRAKERYNEEGENLYKLYGLAGDRYQMDYDQYRDKMADFYQDYANAYNAFSDERNFDYGKFSDMLTYWQQQAAAENGDYWDRTNFDENVRQWQADFDEGVRQFNEDMAYQKGRDAVADSQWAQEFAYQKGQNAIANALAQEKFKYQKDQDKAASDASQYDWLIDGLYDALNKKTIDVKFGNGSEYGNKVVNSIANVVPYIKKNSGKNTAEAERLADQLAESYGLAPDLVAYLLNEAEKRYDEKHK